LYIQATLINFFTGRKETMRKFLGLIGILFILSIPATAQEQPRFQIFGGYSYIYAPQDTDLVNNSNYVEIKSELETHDNGHGWNFSFLTNLNSNLALVAEAKAQYKTSIGLNLKRWPSGTDFYEDLDLRINYRSYSI
jgi:hypothetical protein